MLRDKRVKKPYVQWATLGGASPLLQKMALRVISQVTLFSCCERNWNTYGNLYSLKKSGLEQSRAETMVYVHTNLCLIYRKREEWVKEKTKMWDVFLDDMGLDNSIELALVNMDLNDPVLEPITFDDGDPMEGSSSTPTNADCQMGKEEKEEESSDEFVDSGMEEDY